MHGARHGRGCRRGDRRQAVRRQQYGSGRDRQRAYRDRDYEYYCSSRFFVGRGTTGKEACERAAAGDPRRWPLWREFGEQVGDLVMLVLYAYDPEAIVFGGSISRAFEFFRGSMFERLRAFPMPKPWSGCTSAVRR